MTTFTVLLICLNAYILGAATLLGYFLFRRYQSAEAKEESVKLALSTIQETHNKTITVLEDLQTRVSQHEITLNMRVGTQPSSLRR